MLSYEIIGKGEPLLFMHGLGADRKQTTSALSSLANTQLIAPDFRGHGDSPIDGNPLNFNQFADDVIAILDKQSIHQCNIGGLSMGSGVSINMALRYPERIKKMILLRPSWLDEKEPEHLTLVALAGQFIDEFGLKEGKVKLAAHADYQKLLTMNIKVAHSIMGVFERPLALEAASVLFKMWHDKPFESLKDLQNISNETLVLYTTRDELHPEAAARQISKQLPDNQLAELPPRYYEKEAYSTVLVEKTENFLTA